MLDISNFSYVACVHVPWDIRRKLDDKSEKCIFTGYNVHCKTYKLYNPVTKKFIMSRDVEFKEVEAWDGRIDKSVIVTGLEQVDE